MRTRCAYMWTGLQTCTVPSANGSHTVRHEPKFVGFLHKHKRNCMCCVDRFVLCSLQVRRKLIYHMPSANCLRTIWFACVQCFQMTFPKIHTNANFYHIFIYKKQIIHPSESQSYIFKKTRKKYR